MQRVDTAKMQSLLVEVANIISPGTASEEVELIPSELLFGSIDSASRSRLGPSPP
jgi:hypothetical protein